MSICLFFEETKACEHCFLVYLQGRKEEKMQAKLPPTEPRREDVLQIHTLSKPPDKQPGAQEVSTTYTLIGWILQGGVILSAAVILIGVFMMSLQPDKFAAQKLQQFPQTFSQVWTGLLILRPQAVIALGLLLLIATPVARVAFSVFAFLEERDWMYVGITLLVLAILLFSLLGGQKFI